MTIGRSSRARSLSIRSHAIGQVPTADSGSRATSDYADNCPKCCRETRARLEVSASKEGPGDESAQTPQPGPSRPGLPRLRSAVPDDDQDLLCEMDRSLRGEDKSKWRAVPVWFPVGARTQQTARPAQRPPEGRGACRRWSTAAFDRRICRGLPTWGQLSAAPTTFTTAHFSAVGCSAISTNGDVMITVRKKCCRCTVNAPHAWKVTHPGLVSAVTA